MSEKKKTGKDSIKSQWIEASQSEKKSKNNKEKGTAAKSKKPAMGKKGAPKKAVKKKSGKKKKRGGSRFLMWLKIFALAAALVAIAGGVFFGRLYFLFHSKLPESKCPRRVNAIWARHDWVGKAHKKKDYDDFCQLLIRNGITDVFAHAGPLNAKGEVEADKIEHAGGLIKNMSRACPGVRVQAWLGQVEKAGGGPLDISDKAVRKQIIETASEFMDMGFGGIHYDIEPIRSGNRYYVNILADTRKAAHDRGKVVSVAGGQMELFPAMWKVVEQFANQASFWDKDYYLSVAAAVDQVAVMMYDSQMPTDWLYAAQTKWETRSILRLVGNDRTVFMGMPTYQDNRRKSGGRAENIGAAIKGVRMGIAGMSAEQTKNFGAAIYCEWTTDDKEWAIYRKEWLGVK